MAQVSALRCKLIYKFVNPIATGWKGTGPQRPSHVQLSLLYVSFWNLTVFLFPADMYKAGNSTQPTFREGRRISVEHAGSTLPKGVSNTTVRRKLSHQIFFFISVDNDGGQANCGVETVPRFFFARYTFPHSPNISLRLYAGWKQTVFIVGSSLVWSVTSRGKDLRGLFWPVMFYWTYSVEKLQIVIES